jgi:hypothetical protein
MFNATPQILHAANVKSLAPWEWDEPAPLRVSTNPFMSAFPPYALSEFISLVLSNHVVLIRRAQAARSFLAQRFLLARKESLHGSVKLVASLEEVQLHQEKITNKLSAEFADERSSCGGASSCTSKVSHMLWLKTAK